MTDSWPKPPSIVESEFKILYAPAGLELPLNALPCQHDCYFHLHMSGYVKILYIICHIQVIIYISYSHAFLAHDHVSPPSLSIYHSIAVFGLTQSHPIIQNKLTVNRIEWNKSNNKMEQVKISGKRKKGAPKYVIIVGLNSPISLY